MAVLALSNVTHFPWHLSEYIADGVNRIAYIITIRFGINEPCTYIVIIKPCQFRGKKKHTFYVLQITSNNHNWVPLSAHERSSLKICKCFIQTHVLCRVLVVLKSYTLHIPTVRDAQFEWGFIACGNTYLRDWIAKNIVLNIVVIFRFTFSFYHRRYKWTRNINDLNTINKYKNRCRYYWLLVWVEPLLYYYIHGTQIAIKLWKIQ